MPLKIYNGSNKRHFAVKSRLLSLTKLIEKPSDAHYYSKLCEMYKIAKGWPLNILYKIPWIFTDVRQFSSRLQPFHPSTAKNFNTNIYAC